jgi:hypothetical protein
MAKKENAIELGTKPIGKLEYCIQAIEECGITANDIWFPSMSIRKTRPTIIYNTFNQ